MSIIQVSSHLHLCIVLLVVYYMNKSYTMEYNNFKQFRANVTLKFGLSNDFNSECDETVYKVVVCAGEFTNRCQLVGPVARFIQATCASQGPPESLSFLVSSVENPIELDVTVQKVGEQEIQKLRNTEFRLVEENEVSVTSYDLSLIVRFHVTYSCLPNYFGKMCATFCDRQSVDYLCDASGNIFCKRGYYFDHQYQKCRLDQCINRSNYCLNGGLCKNNPNLDANELPLCICPSEYKGLRCELKNQSHTEMVNRTSLKQNELNKNNSFNSNNNNNKLVNTTTEVNELKTTDYMNREVSKLSVSNIGIITSTPGNSNILQQLRPTTPVISLIINATTTTTTMNLDKTSTTSPSSSSEIFLGVKNPKFINEQNVKRIVILSSVGIILILTVSTGCIGLVLCLIRRKPKENKKSNISNIIGSDSDCYYKPTRRWASVDQSPTSLNNFDSIDYRLYPGGTNIRDTGGADYINTFRESHLQTSNLDGRYGIDDMTSLPNYYSNPLHHSNSQSHSRPQPFRHSSISNTGHHSDLLTENGFATIPRNFYLSNRYNMHWNGIKQPTSCCYVPTLKPLSLLDTGNYGEGFEKNSNDPVMNTFNPSHNSNNAYNEHSTFGVNMVTTMNNGNINTTSITTNNGNNINEHYSKYIQPSYNCLSSSLHDSYISNGYFDRLTRLNNDCTNQNDNYALRNHNENNYSTYKPGVLSTVNDYHNNNNNNRIRMSSSTLPATMSYSSTLPLPPAPPPPLSQALPPPPPSQFADMTAF